MYKLINGKYNLKRSVLIVSFCISVLSLGAQIVNFSAGPTFSKLNWYNSFVSNSNPYGERYVGFSSTMGIDYLQKQHFELSSSLGYLQNGGFGSAHGIKPNNEDTIIDVRTTVSFITTINTARTKIQIGKKMTPFLGLGFRIDYLVSYNESVGLLDQFDEINELNRIILGIVGEAGLKYDLKKWQFSFRFQYNYGMNKLVDYEAQPDYKNEISVDYFGTLISVGYRIK